MAANKYIYKKACFGGTFDLPIHKGHQALIKKAFEVAEFCYIGLTSDYYGWTRKKPAHSFGERKRGMKKFLKSKRIPAGRYRISELFKFFGPELVDPDAKIEAIVVSEMTMPGARGINMIRKDLGLDPLEIVEIKMVRGDDKRPISSTRMRTKEIDGNGHLI